MGRKKICLDFGHGGVDPGAISPTGTQEKHLNLLLGLILKNYLYKDYQIILPRRGDKTVSRPERAEIANEAQADIFISVHFNSATTPQANGTETFFFPDTRGSIYLAKNIQREMVKAIGLRDRGIKQGNFDVIRLTKMPAVLLEPLFITNPDEEKLTRNNDFLVTLAWGITLGIRDYFISKGE